MIAWKPKKRNCKVPDCGERFMAEKPQHWWCCDAHRDELGMIALRKVRAGREKQARKEHRERKKAIERPKDVRPRTQDDFNAMIRERDYFEPCVSCGRQDCEIPEHPTGGKWDCGHFLTRGAHPELAFEPFNAAKQCKFCNRDRNGNVTRYEENLIKRIGADKVAWLKGPHPAKKYTVEQLRAMGAEFRAETRRMKKEREQRGTV